MSRRTARLGPLATAIADYLEGADLYRAQSETVARALGFSIHKFRRSIRDEGVTFQYLLDRECARRTMAALGRNPAYGATYLAPECGYRCESNYYRAFVRWFGVGLSEFKKNRSLGVIQ